MNRWIKIVIGLSLMSLLVLSLAWQYWVYRPQKAQAEFESLMTDASPFLKQRNVNERAKIATSIGALLDTPQNNETPSQKAERLAAKDRVNKATQKAASDLIPSDFEDYKAALEKLDTRFQSLNHSHLTPCQRHKSYKNWGALRLWQSWAGNRTDFGGTPINDIAAYENASAEYTGRPVTFSEIKAVGKNEFEAVQAELKSLETLVGQDLNIFALRPENFSETDAAIRARVEPLLENIEDSFSRSGDFEFAPVPKGTVQTRKGYGPRYAIAVYIKRDNAMRIHWTYGRYNHIYDTMLAVHEIMPGHHLQMKMETQRACDQGPVSARIPFLEGWASYAEILAKERGLFTSPLQRLGWLDYRLVRAMRILIDTARIENGLTEDQAWELWQEKMPVRLNDDFPREWARIKKSPHHLSYIFGSKAILDARETLREKYGHSFDETEFHAALLNAPHQSLMFLAERVDAQMQARKNIELPAFKDIEPAL